MRRGNFHSGGNMQVNQGNFITCAYRLPPTSFLFSSLLPPYTSHSQHIVIIPSSPILFSIIKHTPSTHKSNIEHQARWIKRSQQLVISCKNFQLSAHRCQSPTSTSLDSYVDELFVFRVQCAVLIVLLALSHLPRPY